MDDQNVTYKLVLTEKTCSSCGEVKPLEAFHRHPNCVSGRNSKCKECRKPSSKAGYDERRLNKWWEYLTAAAKTRKIEVSVTQEYLEELLAKQGGACALSGIQVKIGGGASVDRIDSALGYAPGNCQWVHKHMNQMKNSHSQAEFVELCRSVVRHHG